MIGLDSANEFGAIPELQNGVPGMYIERNQTLPLVCFRGCSANGHIAIHKIDTAPAQSFNLTTAHRRIQRQNHREPRIKPLGTFRSGPN